MMALSDGKPPPPSRFPGEMELYAYSPFTPRPREHENAVVFDVSGFIEPELGVVRRPHDSDIAAEIAAKRVVASKNTQILAYRNPWVAWKGAAPYIIRNRASAGSSSSAGSNAVAGPSTNGHAPPRAPFLQPSAPRGSPSYDQPPPSSLPPYSSTNGQRRPFAPSSFPYPSSSRGRGGPPTPFQYGPPPFIGGPPPPFDIHARSSPPAPVKRKPVIFTIARRAPTTGTATSPFLPTPTSLPSAMDTETTTVSSVQENRNRVPQGLTASIHAPDAIRTDDAIMTTVAHTPTTAPSTLFTPPPEDDLLAPPEALTFDDLTGSSDGGLDAFMRMVDPASTNITAVVDTTSANPTKDASTDA
ncbi:hypothetical protein C8R46DRAFT_1205614 [Mycena filopes]|nr:hypothetical protein C8R46DRAFT_1205614 [Mycena filopes]